MLNSSPRKGWELNREAFDEMLAWLNPDREEAGRKYEDIRKRLIRIFMHRGCTVAEDLADETINRVARKVHEIRDGYVGDPALYYYGVARNVYMEYVKHPPEPKQVAPTEDLDEVESEHRCLEQCLGELTPQNQELLLEYYRENEGAKIKHHKEMAERLGLALNALRIRMCRLRMSLKECMRECLKEAAT